MSQAALNTTGTAITSGVNEARFLEHLRTMFSTSTTVLAECMQNARRAGASAVTFDFDAETQTLSVTDDGIGIDDFAKLIVVAESGWSKEVQDSEQPFGIGFFSISFAAESIVVESRGKQIRFSSEDLIGKRQIAVKTASFIGGTRITLHGCKLGHAKLEGALAAYAKGFSIPVVWQGVALPRPHAKTDLAGANTDVGFVHVPGIHAAIQPQQFSVGYVAVYCQGLPVSMPHASRYGETPAVIHVDHMKFKPRMPDRDTLLDRDDADKAFVRSIKALWIAHMEAEKQTLSAEQFATTYWCIAHKTGALNIMNDVPFLPSPFLSTVDETPHITCDGSSFWGGYNGEAVTQELVESGKVRLFHDSLDAESGDDFLRLMWARKEGAVFIDYALPDGHWANAGYVGDLSEGKIKVSGKVTAKGDFSGHRAYGDVKIMQGLTVTWNDISHALSEAVAVGGGNDDYEHRTFLVPEGNNHPGFVVRQASSYIDSSDYFQDSMCDEDQDSFDDLVAILTGEAPEKTLAKCLNLGSANTKTNLRNKTFRVLFDEDGNFTVVAE